MDGVRRDYKITYGRYGSNVTRGFAYASAKAPRGREADAERLAAVIKAHGQGTVDTPHEGRHNNDSM